MLKNRSKKNKNKNFLSNQELNKITENLNKVESTNYVEEEKVENFSKSRLLNKISLSKNNLKSNLPCQSFIKINSHRSLITSFYKDNQKNENENEDFSFLVNRNLLGKNNKNSNKELENPKLLEENNNPSYKIKSKKAKINLSSFPKLENNQKIVLQETKTINAVKFKQKSK